MIRATLHHPGFILLALAACMIAAGSAVTASAAFEANASLLSGAILFDFAALFPAAYWFLVVRPAHAPRRTMIPITALSLVVAGLIIPERASGMVTLIRMLIAPAELALLCYVFWKLWSLRRAGAGGVDSDPLLGLEAALESALGSAAAARMIASEFAMIRYAIAPSRHAPSLAAAFAVPADARLIAVLSVVLVVETVGMHLLLMQWSDVAAWIFTGLSVYSLVWVVGDHRALAARPTLLEPGVLTLRVGLRAYARVIIEDVESVESASWRASADPVPGRLNLASPATPNLLIRFRRPVAVRRYFGWMSQASSVLLRLDRPEEFMLRVKGSQAFEATPHPHHTRAITSRTSESTTLG